MASNINHIQLIDPQSSLTSQLWQISMSRFSGKKSTYLKDKKKNTEIWGWEFISVLDHLPRVHVNPALMSNSLFPPHLSHTHTCAQHTHREGGAEREKNSTFLTQSLWLTPVTPTLHLLGEDSHEFEAYFFTTDGNYVIKVSFSWYYTILVCLFGGWWTS